MKHETRDYRVLQHNKWALDIDSWITYEVYRNIEAHVLWVTVTAQQGKVAHCRLSFCENGDWYRRDAFFINSHWTLHIALPVFSELILNEGGDKVLHEDYMFDRSHWVRLLG